MQYEQHQPQPKEPIENARNLLTCIVFVGRAGAVTVEVILHYGFGSRYLGFCTLMGAAAILFWGVFWEGYDLMPLIYYLYAYLFMLLWARTSTIVRGLRGTAVHSRYTGTPRIWCLLPWMSEKKVKHLEALLVLLAGVFVLPASEPLGSYLMFAAVCLWISFAEMEYREQYRSADMQDAVIEQEQLMDRFREMRGRR